MTKKKNVIVELGASISINMVTVVEFISDTYKCKACLKVILNSYGSITKMGTGGQFLSRSVLNTLK